MFEGPGSPIQKMIDLIVGQPLLHPLRQSRQCLRNRSTVQLNKDNYLLETHSLGDSRLCQASILGHMLSELNLSSTKRQNTLYFPSYVEVEKLTFVVVSLTVQTWAPFQT